MVAITFVVCDEPIPGMLLLDLWQIGCGIETPQGLKERQCWCGEEGRRVEEGRGQAKPGWLGDSHPSHV
jgi:hypothetical protein